MKKNAKKIRISHGISVTVYRQGDVDIVDYFDGESVQLTFIELVSILTEATKFRIESDVNSVN